MEYLTTATMGPRVEVELWNTPPRIGAESLRVELWNTSPHWISRVEVESLRVEVELVNPA